MEAKSVPDADWLTLFDDEVMKKRRAEAEHKYRDLTTLQIEKMRGRAKRDLFFLSSAILDYELLSPSFHGHYMNWLKRVQGQRYRLTLLARDHYKSTGNTIADSVQMALPGGEDLPHPYNLGPDVKVLLSHENQESASRFLFEITQAFRAKPLMLALYPELIPSPRIQRMNKLELELPRSKHHREPTFDTIGVGGAAQSRHYNWLKLDDLVGEKARDSLTVMNSVLQWFDNNRSLLTRLKIDGWDLVGTRWAATDVYSHAIKMYGVNKKLSILNVYSEEEVERMEEGQLVIYARGALENGLPIFPEEFALEDLLSIRKNKRVWAAQYANNPKDGELTKLDPNHLRFYNIASGDKIVVFDDAGGSRTIRTSELDRVVMIDPSVGETTSADESGFVVTGTDSKMNIYVLEAYKKTLRPPDLMDELLRLYTKWNPRLISIEDFAFQAVLKYWFSEKCKNLGIRPAIYPFKDKSGGGKRSKPARIEGLSNYAAGGQLYVLQGMHQLRDEWEWFPLGDSEHILDALAQGPEVWTPAVVKTKEEVEKAVQLLMEDRDEVTGYSAIN